MAVDDLFRVVIEVTQADEAAALADLRGAGYGIALRVAEERGRFVFLEDVLLPPVNQVGGGAGVYVVGFGVRLALAQDDADQVVGALRIVGVLHGRRDLVVRLGHHVFKADGGGVVAKRAKRVNLHEPGDSPGMARFGRCC